MSRVCVCKFWVLFLNSDRSRHHVCKLVVSETLVVICVCWIGSDGDILEYFESESRHVTSVRIVVGVMCIESFFRFLTTHIYFFPLHSPSRGCRACKHRGSGPLGCKDEGASRNRRIRSTSSVRNGRHAGKPFLRYPDTVLPCEKHQTPNTKKTRQTARSSLSRTGNAPRG